VQRTRRFFINIAGKLTGSEIKLYFDFNEQKTIRCGRGRKAWCYPTEIFAVEQENSSATVSGTPLSGVHPAVRSVV